MSSFLGIDFGTTNSSMAWVDPASGRAELIHNAEGERETPSIVYFGEDEVRVGRAAEHTLDNDAAEKEELQRVVTSIKRYLISPPQITLPGGQYKRPVEVVAEILAKLKRDAETGHFAKEVTRAVITCPALFDTLQRNVIIEAAGLAGFAEVEMLDEPVAAALGFARGGQRVGKGVLVYDLGGGTFDLAFVKREDDDTFDLAMDTEGKADCGGDDFDQLLYDYWDHQARKDLGRSISLANTTINRPFLRQCRLKKETLTTGKQCMFSTTLPGGQSFRATIDRETFEELIRTFIEETVRQTQHMWQRVQERGYEVDTLLMVGGSARIPLVNRLLEEALPIIPRRWHHQDVAVALGAACYAQKLWGTKKERRRGADVEATLEISEEEASEGAEITLGVDVPEIMSNGVARSVHRAFIVKIPKGVKAGSKLRLRAKGGAGINGGQNGDLIVTVAVKQKIDGAQDRRVHVADRPEKTRSAVDDYLAVVIPRFQADGFECAENVQFGEFVYRYAAKCKGSCFIFSEFHLDNEHTLLEYFTTTAYAYLSQTLSYRREFSRLCVPVALINGASEYTYALFSRQKPVTRGWKQDHTYPVLCDVRSRQMTVPTAPRWEQFTQSIESYLQFTP